MCGAPLWFLVKKRKTECANESVQAARRWCLQQARLETVRYAKTDYLVVLDADMCHRWDVGSFALALSTPPPWAVVSANGVGRLLPQNRFAYIYIDSLAWIGYPNTTMGAHDLSGHNGMHGGMGDQRMGGAMGGDMGYIQRKQQRAKLTAPELLLRHQLVGVPPIRGQHTRQPAVP